MGAGASQQTVSTPSVARLEAPFSVGDDHCYPVIPHEDHLKQKSETLILEVGYHGFRLLRPKLMDPLLVWSWGQIHSWSHTQIKPQEAVFSFRFFDDTKRAIEQINLSLRDVDPLLEHIQEVVESILGERKNNVVSDEEFEALMEALRRAQGAQVSSTPAEVVSQRMQTARFFMADQGRAMMELCPTSFDKIELAVLLHARLVDQARFYVVLETIADPAERDNVWARITSAKKPQHGLGASGTGSPSSLRARSTLSVVRTGSSTGGAGLAATAVTSPTAAASGPSSSPLSRGAVTGCGTAAAALASMPAIPPP